MALSRRYAFPLAAQLAMPPRLDDPGFLTLLDTLERLGFCGIELNIVDFDSLPPEAYLDPLAKRHLRLLMIATGACAKKKNLSLSSPDQLVREQTLREMEKCLALASRLEAGAICGFIKGMAGQDRGQALKNFRESLARLDSIVRRFQTPILIEATNHYEATLANTLAETAKILDGFDNPHFHILPDTYHMNIEEASPLAALVAQEGRYVSIHVSDNNRRFPGFGALDFRTALAILEKLRFPGFMAIEGRAGQDILEDLAISAKHLEEASRPLLFED
ncbi:MAG: sugar phosphate isomerase/epimerase [Planctomycetota bacterium]|nr:sugar phosphate isomerase/epimerase [Planctomycetota bacterium]